MVSQLCLLALGAAALVSASPLCGQQAVDLPSVFAPLAAEAAPTSFSKGFRLAAVPTDHANPLASAVHGLFLNAYHIGAGINKAVLHAVDAHNPGAVFYLNKKPGHPESILTDAGPLPYSFSVPPPGGKDAKSVVLPVGDVGSPVVITDAGSVSKCSYVKNGLPASEHGSFLACKRPVPYYHNNELVVLEYAYGAPPPGCVPIQLVLQCATLPAPQHHGPASHEFAQTVPCCTHAF